MDFNPWITKVEKILMQYTEGAIFAEEAFDAIVAQTVEILQSVEYSEYQPQSNQKNINE